MAAVKPTPHLQQLIHRTDRVLAVLHAPSAAHARLMEAAGVEVAFVGTSGVVGAYTGLADAFQTSRHGRPYPHPLRLEAGETVAKQRELEQRYATPDRLEPYQPLSDPQAAS